MSKFGGVSKIIIQKSDGLNYVIDGPQVLNRGSAFAVFGELTLDHKALVNVLF